MKHSLRPKTNQQLKAGAIASRSLWMRGGIGRHAAFPKTARAPSSWPGSTRLRTNQRGCREDARSRPGCIPRPNIQCHSLHPPCARISSSAQVRKAVNSDQKGPTLKVSCAWNGFEAIPLVGLLLLSGVGARRYNHPQESGIPREERPSCLVTINHHYGWQ